MNENSLKIKVNKKRLISRFAMAVVLRFFGALVCWATWLLLFLSFNDRSTEEKVFGFSILLLGFVLVVTPKAIYKKIIGFMAISFIWFYFYVFCLLYNKQSCGCFAPQILVCKCSENYASA
jgi:hypothetical protein